MKPYLEAVRFGDAYRIDNTGGTTSKQKAQAIRQLAEQSDVDRLAHSGADFDMLVP